MSSSDEPRRGGRRSRTATPPRIEAGRMSLFRPSPVLDYATDMARTINEGRDQLRETQLKWTMVKADINQLQERLRLPQDPADFQRTHPSASLQTLTRLTNEKNTYFAGLTTETDNFDSTINTITDHFDRMSTESADVRRQLLATEYNQSKRSTATRPANQQPRYPF